MVDRSEEEESDEEEQDDLEGVRTVSPSSSSRIQSQKTRHLSKIRRRSGRSTEPRTWSTTRTWRMTTST